MAKDEVFEDNRTYKYKVVKEDIGTCAHDLKFEVKGDNPDFLIVPETSDSSDATTYSTSSSPSGSPVIPLPNATRPLAAEGSQPASGGTPRLTPREAAKKKPRQEPLTAKAKVLPPETLTTSHSASDLHENMVRELGASVDSATSSGTERPTKLRAVMLHIEFVYGRMTNSYVAVTVHSISTR